jgi:GNAT superfamily N-acetyltransferase
MEFIIREANQADYAGLCAIFAEVHALHLEALPHIFREPDGPALSAEFVDETIADQRAALFVAEREGQIIGLVYLSQDEAPNQPILMPRRYVSIHTLAVRKDCRHAGVGRALMERAHRWAYDQGVYEIELNVWEFNTLAIEFYEQLGYATASRKMSTQLASRSRNTQ